jgi:flagellar biosynthesis GTPase FlhF
MPISVVAFKWNEATALCLPFIFLTRQNKQVSKGALFLSVSILCIFFNYLCDNSMLFYPFLSFEVAKTKLIEFGTWRQNIYNKITILLFEQKYIGFWIRLYHKSLMLFRLVSIAFFEYIEKYISSTHFILILSYVVHRLHIAGWFIAFCLVFFVIDLRTLPMLRFYKRYPNLVETTFPQTSKRYMWSKTAKILQEAASNPQVQIVATGVAGALVWKGLDVYDTQTQKIIADKDREAENARAAADRQAENERADKDREAETSRHQEEMAMRERELEEAKASRRDENTRHQEEMAMREKELESPDSIYSFYEDFSFSENLMEDFLLFLLMYSTI